MPLKIMIQMSRLIGMNIADRYFRYDRRVIQSQIMLKAMIVPNFRNKNHSKLLTSGARGARSISP